APSSPPALRADALLRQLRYTLTKGRCRSLPLLVLPSCVEEPRDTQLQPRVLATLAAQRPHYTAGGRGPLFMTNKSISSN
ncbi:hypothetical protein PanWU01x14_241910, partial [Parasponia andersonii]